MAAKRAALVQRHVFPDGESRLRLPPGLPAQLLLPVGLLIAAPAAWR